MVFTRPHVLVHPSSLSNARFTCFKRAKGAHLMRVPRQPRPTRPIKPARVVARSLHPTNPRLTLDRPPSQPPLSHQQLRKTTRSGLIVPCGSSPANKSHLLSPIQLLTNTVFLKTKTPTHPARSRRTNDHPPSLGQHYKNTFFRALQPLHVNYSCSRSRKTYICVVNPLNTTPCQLPKIPSLDDHPASSVPPSFRNGRARTCCDLSR